MKTKFARTTAIGFTGLLILSALAIFTPSVAAQNEIQASADTAVKRSYTETLLPDTGLAEIEIETVVTINAGSACIVGIKVSWNKGNTPSYSSVVFNPSSQTKAFSGENNQPVAGAQPRPVIFNTKATITVTREAPAFKDDTYEFIAKVETSNTAGGCNVKAPSDSKATTTIKNGYFPLTQISPQSLFVKAGQNKKVVFPVDIMNLGNGPTRVKVDLIAAGKNRLDSMNAGAEVRLETRAGKGASAQYKQSRNIEVQTPHSNGYTNSIYSFNAKFLSQYDGPTSGTPAQDETSVTFSVQVQGVYVPGYDATSLIVALGIALVGMVQFRRRN